MAEVHRLELDFSSAENLAAFVERLRDTRIFHADVAPITKAGSDRRHHHYAVGRPDSTDPIVPPIVPRRVDPEAITIVLCVPISPEIRTACCACMMNEASSGVLFEKSGSRGTGYFCTTCIHAMGQT